MNGSSWSAPRSSRALRTWIVVLSLGAFGCARAHHEGVRASDGRPDREGTTRDPASADEDEEGDDDDDAPPTAITPTPVRGVPAGAGARPVAEPSDDERSTGELMADLFVEYQRDGSLRCPCHVETGVYATLQDCLDASIRQRPQVNDCLDRSVAPDALRELRSWVRCITEIKREHNACLEQASCEEDARCAIDTKRCSFPDATRVAMAINQCPQAITVGP